MAKSKEKSKVKLKVDPELVAQAAALYESLGLDLSTATRIFYLQSLRCHGLPFPLRADEPNAVTLAAMEEAECDEDMYGPFDSVEEMMKSLNS